jgi:hypothetical protein
MKLTLALAILAMILWVGTLLGSIPAFAAVIVTLAAIVAPSFQRWRRSG